MSLRVLFVAAEATPFSKVGGLADVAGSLPQALAARGMDVRLVTPRHNLAEPAAPRTFTTLFRGSPRGFEVCEAELAEGARTWLISDGAFFPRPAVYGENDDLDRYLFFSQVALELPQLIGWQPDVIHINDWHTGPMAYALRNYAWNDDFYRKAVSVFTIHNLRYRGPDSFVDFIGPAIFYSDVVTTVSPTYAKEILTPEMGEGLHELLRVRQESLYGVVNGIDYQEFNPATDPRIAFTFEAQNLERREGNRSTLRTRLDLLDGSAPIVAMVTRLSEQKGIEIALEGLEMVLEASEIRVVILGTGDKPYEEQALGLAERHPGKVAVTIGFDAALAQQIYAGSDIFLMPSRFEPCGLGQMIAMRYGSIPVVRRTGGLADTVPDADKDDLGLGFVFDDYSASALRSALQRAIACFRDRASWQQLQRRAMLSDFSWSASAESYEAIYDRALTSRRQ